MDRLKKVGLSALAGTLATLSAAQAGSLSVSGTAEISYVQRDSDEVTGNPLGMGKDITFNGSGELDNGWTVSVMHDLSDAAAWSSSAITIGMGSLGTLIFDQSAGKDMGSALDNVVPTAFEEADAGMATGLVVSGGAINDNGSIVYKLPVIAGAQIGVAYNPRSGAPSNADGATSESTGGRGYEFAVDWSPEMVPGLRVGGAVGQCEDCKAGNKDLDEETWFATYTYGPLSIGYQVADEDDEVIIKLESPGGMVHSYGLAASQLQRIVSRKVSLTIAVDKVAASGGYMMACIGTKIIAAPFALLGSIGVVAQIPNFHRLLKNKDVDVEVLTAGEYKRTLTMFGENTDKGREKFIEELEDVHTLFKDFVSDNRPSVDMQKVATGEAWYGKRALDLNLVDELKTSDEYIIDKCTDSAVFLVKFVEHQNRMDKLMERFALASNRLSGTDFLQREQGPYTFQLAREEDD